MATLLPEGKQSFTKADGTPMVGGKLYTYEAGTSTPKATYADAAGTVQNTNPLILDARGEATIYWSGSYKVALKDASDVLVWTVDNVSIDASAVSYKPSGTGSVATNVQSKFREFVSVKDFGAKGDGANDDYAAIMACIEANPGRRIFFPKGVYLVSNTIWNKYDGTVLEGETNGSYTFGQGSGYNYGTTIKWGGAAGSTVVVKVARYDSTTAPYSFSGGGIKNIRIDCAGTNYAGTGLYIPDANNCVFEHIKIDSATVRGLDLTGYVPDISGINSVYNCSFRDLMITVSGSGDGIYMGDTPNAGGGDHPAFVSFDNLHITYGSGIAVNIYEGDDLSFNNVGISRVAGGTGDAIVIQGSGAHGNHFRCINVTQTDGTAPKIWCKTGVRATYFELAGIDKNIRPTIDSGAEAFYLYLGSNNTAYDSEFRSPAIRLPNIAKGEATYLDWYEEGTFTPGIAFGGASVGVTYGYQNGRYVRIGRTVFIHCSFSLTAKGSSIGNATLTGIPFSSSSANTSYSAIRPITGFTVGSVDNGMGIAMGNSVSVGNIMKQTNSSGGMIQMTDADFTATAQLAASFFYEV